ncbi:MAG: mechanosensitive ion channel [Oceanospirillaceae bacterium]|nr:mechanosensitive ion channel [Oceanospirillaceae bacterium]
MDTFSNLRDILASSFTEFLQTLAAYLPNLITALLLLLLGWLFARLIQALVLRFGSGIDHLTARLRRHSGPAALPLRKPDSNVIARILYWLVFLFFLAAAVESMGLPGLADWITQLIQYLPKLIIGGLILLGGYLLGGLVQDLVRAAALARGLSSSDALGASVKVLIVVFAAILGIGHLGLNVGLLVNVVTIAVAAILGGLGLAFGIGASAQVSNILAAHQLRKVYRVGQKVRVDETEGDILEMTSTAVILDTDEGRTLVPARRFADSVSVLKRRGETDD